jgi:hypothetical protein
MAAQAVVIGVASVGASGAVGVFFDTEGVPVLELFFELIPL